MPTISRGLPLHPLLFAAYAVLFLYASNLSEADFGQVFPVLLIVVGIVAALLVAGSVVLRDSRRAAVLLSAFVVFFFGYRHAVILAEDSAVAGRPLQVLWLLLGLGALFLAWRGGRTLLTATRALNAISAGLIIVALVAIVPHEVGEVSVGEPTAAEPLPSVTPTSGPLRDIWVLVFDRYGSAASLRLNYGIEERLTPWLTEHGFHVTPDAHANYSRTRLSLASSLNLDYLDALDVPTANLLNDHALGRFLTDLGYRYIHIGSRYEPTRSAASATVNRRLENTSDFATALFDSSLAPSMLERLGQVSMDIRRQRQAAWGQFELDALDETLDEPGPKFVFAHLLLPHPPYVFDANGELVPDDVDRKRSTAEAYEAQMTYLDKRIKALLEPLLARPEDERPIIVLMADEGPYPKRYEGNPLIQGPDPDFDWSAATDEELRIKFGILHAMLLPGIDDAEVPENLTSVNTLRFLLDAYFDADLPLLPNRILVPIAGKDVDVADRLGVEP
jgi:hypothetical protein